MSIIQLGTPTGVGKSMDAVNSKVQNIGYSLPEAEVNNNSGNNLKELSVEAVQRSNLNADHVKTVASQDAVREDASSVAEDSLSAEKLQQLIDRLNQSIPAKEVALKFEIDSVLDRPVMTVLDANTGQVLRQVPSEEVLRAIHNIDLMRGIIFDELS